MKTLVNAKSFGGLSAGDRFRITDTETGEVVTSTVQFASYYAEDPEATLLWSVVTDDGEPWDLFPPDLKDPTYERIT